MTIDEILGRVTIEVDPHVAILKEGSTGMALVQLAAEVRRLREDSDRLRRERAEALTVHTKEGLLASEWVARTGRAEAKLARVEALTEILMVQAKDIIAANGHDLSFVDGWRSASNTCIAAILMALQDEP